MPFPARRTIARSIAIPLALLGATEFSEAQITWGSTFFSTNRDSTGADLDADFIFYLGVFNPPSDPGDPDWEPTPSNTDEWINHWITADAVVYNTAPAGGGVPINNFSSVYLPVEFVEGVTLTDKQGYIWGVNRRYPNAEWLLVTNPSWSWPATGIFGFPANWQVNQATPILGQVDQGGLHMQFAAVTNSLPPLVRPDIWLQTYFSQDEIDNEQATRTGWNADPDNDKVPNILEFAFVTHPEQVNRTPQTAVGSTKLSGQTYQTLSATIDPNADLILAAEVSADLVDWWDDASNVVVDSQTSSLIIFRDLTPRSPANPFRAIRFRATLP